MGHLHSADNGDRLQSKGPHGEVRQRSDAYPELRNGVQDIRLDHVIRRVQARWRTLLVIVAVFVMAGLIVILGMRNEYDAAATLVPEKMSEGAASSIDLGMLGQVGDLIGGVDAGALLGRSQFALSVQMYPRILHSTPVLMGILSTRVSVPSEDTTVSVGTYLADYKPFSLWSTPLGAAGDVLSDLLGSARDEPTALLTDSAVVLVDGDQRQLLEDLEGRLEAEIDQRTGVLNISATMPDPHVAAQVASASVSQLTEYVTRYRLRKLNENLAFIEERHKEAREGFDAALADLARFRDENQNLARDVARTQEERLQAEYDLRYSVYSTLASRLEETKLKVQEETPVFQVLQPVTVPLEKSHPKTLLILFLMLVLGAITGVIYVGFVAEADWVQSLRRPESVRRRDEERSVA